MRVPSLPPGHCWGLGESNASGSSLFPTGCLRKLFLLDKTSLCVSQIRSLLQQAYGCLWGTKQERVRTENCRLQSQGALKEPALHGSWARSGFTKWVTQAPMNEPMNGCSGPLSCFRTNINRRKSQVLFFPVCVITVQQKCICPGEYRPRKRGDCPTPPTATRVGAGSHRRSLT